MSGTVHDNLLCISCGYDLRELELTGVCPECGTDIKRSLYSERLEAADPDWLSTISRGQRLLALGMLIAVLAAVLFVISLAGFALLSTMYPRLPMAFERVYRIVQLILTLAIPIGLLMAAAGVFLVTTQQGRDRDRESMWSARHVARGSMYSAIILAVAAFSLPYLLLSAGAYPLVNLTFSVVLLALVTSAIVAILKHLAAHVRRVPDHLLEVDLKRSARFICWGLPLAGIYLLLPQLFVRVGAGPPTMPLVAAPLMCAGVVALIGLLFTCARLVSQMRRCDRNFRVCLAASRERG